MKSYENSWSSAYISFQSNNLEHVCIILHHCIQIPSPAAQTAPEPWKKKRCEHLRNKDLWREREREREREKKKRKKERRKKSSTILVLRYSKTMNQSESWEMICNDKTSYTDKGWQRHELWILAMNKIGRAERILGPSLKSAGSVRFRSQSLGPQHRRDVSKYHW